MNRDGIAWRSKGGQTFSIIRADINTIQWARNSRQYQLRVSVKAGANYKYDGFNETDQRNLSQFVKENYSIDPKLMEISTKGSNAGRLKMEGRVLTFFVDDKRAFEVPLNEVAQSSVPAKNEVQIEFHHDDTAADDAESLVEMRLFVPNVKENTNGEAPEGEEAAADEKTQAEIIASTIATRADVVPATGKGILTFEELTVLTPRGRYDVELFPTFMKMHGKTYDYKIKYSNIVRLFLLPKPDKRHQFFVISMEPPIRQGHTSYPHIVIQIPENELIEADINVAEDEKEERLKALEPKVQGPLYQVVMNMFKTVTEKKVTIPSKNFISASGGAGSGIKSSLRASEGYLFLLDRSLFFVHKPATHIRFEEVDNIEFSRIGTDGANTNRTFDLVATLKNGSSFSFTSIQRNEYASLYNYLSTKGLKILTDGTASQARVMQLDDNSDEEAGDAPAADDRPEAAKKYGQRKSAATTRLKVQQDLKMQRFEEESEDDDFAVGEDEDEEEDDHEISSEGGGGGSGSDDDDDSENKEKKHKKDKKRKRESTGSEERPKKKSKPADDE
eukprot:TRINITY_DN993_c0_g1_i1.p1 TRINITY_DN993_c0_g1~~TRINITY_DN993_c0_g1_i1.p1  ORF type:complete len:596 (-),score=209.48 TRINITY_DN993_c0_g1_i1:85-1764(-)